MVVADSISDIGSMDSANVETVRTFHSSSSHSFLRHLLFVQHPHVCVHGLCDLCISVEQGHCKPVGSLGMS